MVFAQSFTSSDPLLCIFCTSFSPSPWTRKDTRRTDSISMRYDMILLLLCSTIFSHSTYFLFLESADDEDEVLLILAEKLGKYVAKKFEMLICSFVCFVCFRITVCDFNCCVGEMCTCVGGDEHVHRLLGPLELLATVEESAVREMVGYLILSHT